MATLFAAHMKFQVLTMVVDLWVEPSMCKDSFDFHTTYGCTKEIKSEDEDIGNQQVLCPRIDSDRIYRLVCRSGSDRPYGHRILRIESVVPGDPSARHRRLRTYNPNTEELSLKPIGSLS